MYTPGSLPNCDPPLGPGLVSPGPAVQVLRPLADGMRWAQGTRPACGGHGAQWMRNQQRTQGTHRVTHVTTPRQLRMPSGKLRPTTQNPQTLVSGTPRKDAQEGTVPTSVEGREETGRQWRKRWVSLGSRSCSSRTPSSLPRRVVRVMSPGFFQGRK